MADYGQCETEKLKKQNDVLAQMTTNVSLLAKYSIPLK